MTIPAPWAGVLLALGAYRLLRLVLVDEVLDRPRKWLLYRDSEPRAAWLITLANCYWCAGWWVSLAVFAAYEAWPHGTLVVMAPLALSTALAVVGRNLDGS